MFMTCKRVAAIFFLENETRYEENTRDQKGVFSIA